MNVGSLFSGIGGFDLGFERAGMRVAWQCELDDYCRRVLAKHWPGVPCYSDIRELCGSDVEPVDVLCGGFPCQDLSVAGKGAGLTGERSGLWFEYLRVIGELRPRYVVVENVPQLRKYLGVVLGGLAEAGYDAEWDRISARDFGAPHLRQRLWIVGYANGTGSQGHGGSVTSTREWPAAATCRGSRARDMADAQREGELQQEGIEREVGQRPRDCRPRGRAAQLADAQGVGRRAGEEAPGHTRIDGSESFDSSWWLTEPDVGRVANGVPARVDRLRGLGNALVPQIAEWIGWSTNASPSA